MIFGRNSVATLLIATGLAFVSLAHAHGNEWQQIPSSLLVKSGLASAPEGVVELKFRDFFKMPVGPRGLEPSDKLLGLDGKRVRIVGYMANAESPTPGMFILSPLPVELGDEDESLSDDLPPSALFVHMDASTLAVPHIPGLIKVTGILHIGNRAEADGHVSLARLQLDPEITADIVRMLSQHQASQ